MCRSLACAGIIRVNGCGAGQAIQPGSGDLFIANTDARNLVHFEPNVRSHAVDNRISRISIGSGGATFEMAAFTLASYSGAITGTGGLTKEGSGFFVVLDNTTYNGPITVNKGDFSYADATTSSTFTANNGGTATLNGGTYNPGFGVFRANAGGTVRRSSRDG